MVSNDVETVRYRGDVARHYIQPGFPIGRQWQWTWPVEFEVRPVLKAPYRLVNRPGAGRTMVSPA
jgi:hypothetical protein